MSEMKRLFEPRSLAVIGASHNPEKIGHKILRNILSSGYEGRVYPVNPKGGEILGLKVYRNLEELRKEVGERELDLAIISVPAKLVRRVVEDCSKVEAGFLVIISSGFSEVGNVEEEREIVRIARENGMRVLGPNVFGIYSARAKLNATFGPSEIRPGKIAIVTQSGAIGIAMMGKISHEGLGVSAIVSVGNKADIDESDLLDYLGKQKETEVIFSYMEGVKEGEKLIKKLREVSRRKHVVVIKAGRSRRGAIAAASHTGSLAGSDEVFEAVMRQCGVLRAENIEEALDWCRFLVRAPLPRGEETLIVTNGGGLGVMATDACEKYGVKLYDDQLVLKNFSDLVPEFGSTKNPVDLTGNATPEHYRKALMKALEIDEISSVITIFSESALLPPKDIIEVIEEFEPTFLEKRKPIVFSMFGGAFAEEISEELSRKGVQVFNEVYRAVSSLGALYYRYRYLNRKEEGYAQLLKEDSIEEIRNIVKNALEEGRTFLLSTEAWKIMDILGIPRPEYGLARTLEEAISVSKEIGYPVALKVVSPQLMHKSDVGGVQLNIRNEEELKNAYQAVTTGVRIREPKAQVIGVEVCEMVPKGVETIVGSRRDPSFGPIVLFGLGGIYVEVMKDVSFRAFPISKREAMEMIGEIRSFPILLGVRGEKKKDIESISDAIIKIGEVVSRVPEISDFEINPLFVYGRGVKAVDVKIILSK